MTTKIPKNAELDQALSSEQTVLLVDSAGQATHVVIPLDQARIMFQDYLGRELQRGLEQSNRGESKPWDLEATLAEARRQRADRTKQP